jgi:hypothetical protein
MPIAKIILCIVSLSGVYAQAQRESSQTRQQTRLIAVVASNVLDIVARARSTLISECMFVEGE